MGAQVDRLAWILADATLAAALLLTAIALAMVLTRQPVRRCALARGALVASLVLIPLVIFRPVARFEIRGPLRSLAPPVGGSSPEGPGATAQAGPGLTGSSSEWILRAVTLLAGALVGLNLAWLALGIWAAGRMARRSSEPSATTRALYESLPFPGSRRPALRVSTRAMRPVLLGIARPLILIPVGLDRPEALEPLRLSLLHELVHAARRDPWFGLVGGLAQAVWFALPPVWWIRAQMRLDQEFLADRQASAGFGPFGTYAASLVDLAGPDPPPGPSPIGRGPGLGGSALFLRVLMLVRCPFPVESRAPAWWRWGIPPALAVATVLVSCLTLQSREPIARPWSRPAPFLPEHGVFTLSRLSIEDPPAHPYPIPLKLPPRFRLTLEVWADSTASLSELRIVGRRLAPTGASRPPEGFHTVQVRKDRDGPRVWVDGRPLPPEPDPPPMPDSLTVQAGRRQAILLRNLRLVW